MCIAIFLAVAKVQKNYGFLHRLQTFQNSRQHTKTFFGKDLGNGNSMFLSIELVEIFHHLGIFV
jgi:hypothetical protein